jgi:hypothetical protein
MKRKLYWPGIKAAAMALPIFVSSCVSSTLIQSNPSAARIYIDGIPVGTTPYQHSDTKIVGSTTYVKLEKEGYETLSATFSRSEEPDPWAIIGGILTWVPYLWVMKYYAVRTYQLYPPAAPLPVASNPKSEVWPVQPGTKESPSKADRLRELKQLLDEKRISQEDYETEKKKILAE